MAITGAYIGQGIAQGAESARQYISEAPEREMNRQILASRVQQAQSQASMSQQQAQEYSANAPVRSAQRDNEMAKLKQQTYQTNANLARQQTYDAFRMYDADKDTRHLNNWLKQSKTNPVSANITQGMIRLDKMERNQFTENALRAQGITDLDGFFSDKTLTDNYAIGTTTNGDPALVDLSKMYAVTGYAQYATEEQRKQISANAAVMQKLRAGANLQDIKQDDAVVGQVADLLNTSRAEAYRILKEKPKAGTGSSSIERVAEQLRSTNPDLSYRDSLVQAGELTRSPKRETDQAKFISDYMANNPDASQEDALTAYREAGKDQRTSTVKNVEYSEDAKEQLDQEFGGDFLTADLSKLDSKQQASIAKYINRIEQAGGVKLSNEDKRNARNMKKLLGLGGQAGSALTAQETGPVDSMLRTVKNYISDNVQGSQGTRAYESFRAIMRNALFGSQVSGSDYAAFNKAFAGLEQQTGPVLASLRTQMEIIRDDLDATVALNDPYVAKARFGVDIDQVDDIINALNDRINLISGVENGKPDPKLKIPAGVTGSDIRVNVAPQGEPAQPAGERPSLDSIFGGNQ